MDEPSEAPVAFEIPISHQNPGCRAQSNPRLGLWPPRLFSGMIVVA